MADKRIIATAGIVTVAVGSVNAIGNHKKLPSSKFLIGSGVLFLILSIMADAGQEEIAKALSIAVMTTVILGEGNGVLSWINHGEVDTKKTSKTPNAPRDTHGLNTETGRVIDVYALRNSDRPDKANPYPGVPATR